MLKSSESDRPISEIQLVLLGRAHVLHGGYELPLRTRKTLALVAYLALEGSTRRSKLAGLLWSDLDRASGLANLRREIFRLHPTPLWSLLEINADTVGFHLVPPSDVTQFNACLEAGQLHEALTCYGGPLLDGLDLQGAEGFERWLVDRQADLLEAYLGALLNHAGALEASGDLRGALAAHLEFLRKDELQELVHCQIMRLHALLGERELALRRFVRLKEVLAQQLGLTPLPETTAMAERIRLSLSHETLQTQPQTVSFLVPPLIGREREWSSLVQSDAGFCLAVSDPGLGKTRLMEEFARSRTATVLIQGMEATMATPLTPLAEALRQAMANPASAVRMATLPAVWRQEAAWLVPELAPGASTSVPSPEGRDRFLESLARALMASAGPGGTVIFDDLHWCDASTVEVALHLIRLSREGECRVVGTARPADLVSNGAATRFVDALARKGQLLQLELAPLNNLEVLTLVRALSGGLQAQLFAQRLFEATGGNPLYLLETLGFLFASGLLTVDAGGWSTPFDDATSDYAELPVPSSVSEAVLKRVDALGGITRRLLELASLAGNTFRLDWLVGASALTEWEQIDAVERALKARLIFVQELGYQFSHDLIRRALDSSIGLERRTLSHRRLAENLRQQDGAPGQIAGHHEQAGQRVEAVEYRIRAAEAATRVFAHQEALSQYTLALSDGAAGRVKLMVHLARAELLFHASEFSAVAAELTLASRLAATLGAPDLAARVSLAEAGLQNALGRYSEVLTMTEPLLSGGGRPSRLQASLQYERSVALLRLGRLGEAEAGLNDAITQVPPDAHDLIGHLQTLLQACAMQRGLLPQAQTHNALARQAFQAAGNRLGAVKALGGQGLLTGLLGDARAAVQVLTGALMEARELQDVSVQRTLLLNLFKFLLEAGDLETAVVRLEEGLALAREPQDPYLEGVFLNNLGTVQRLRGDLGGALRAVMEALNLADHTGIAQHRIRRRITLAENHLDLGDLGGTLTLLQDARSLGEENGLGELAAWHETLLARCDLALGDPQAALTRLESLLRAGTAVDPDDLARTVWVSGLARLALGLPRAETSEDGPVLWPLDPLLHGWALSVRLGTTGGQVGPDSRDITNAENLLASGQMLPVEALGLERALITSLLAAGDSERAGNHLRAASRLVLRLAGSLDAFPELQATFLKAYRDFFRPVSP